MKELRVTKRQLKKLEQNLNGGTTTSKKTDEILIGLLHRMYWRNWSAITGKTLTFEVIHAPRNVQNVNDFVKEFLPELRKKGK